MTFSEAMDAEKASDLHAIPEFDIKLLKPCCQIPLEVALPDMAFIFQTISRNEAVMKSIMFLLLKFHPNLASEPQKLQLLAFQEFVALHLNKNRADQIVADVISEHKEKLKEQEDMAAYKVPKSEPIAHQACLNLSCVQRSNSNDLEQNPPPYNSLFQHSYNNGESWKFKLSLPPLMKCKHQGHTQHNMEVMSRSQSVSDKSDSASENMQSVEPSVFRNSAASFARCSEKYRCQKGHSVQPFVLQYPANICNSRQSLNRPVNSDL